MICIIRGSTLFSTHLFFINELIRQLVFHLHLHNKYILLASRSLGMSTCLQVVHVYSLLHTFRFCLGLSNMDTNVRSLDS